MSRPAGKKPRSKLFWVVVVLVGIPILFYLFEVVVPRLLPPNF